MVEFLKQASEKNEDEKVRESCREAIEKIDRTLESIERFG